MVKFVSFPHVNNANDDGLLAMGGDLTLDTLVSAYAQGVFPWFNDDQPILWWSPDPRCVLFPEKLKISRSLRKTLNKNLFVIKQDTAFRDVMLNCAKPRKDEAGTWITRDMLEAYSHMHELGYAHSIECWHDDNLVGGLYGISLGEMFFGESMYSDMPDASKVALEYLCNTIKPKLIDVQIHSEHMQRLGAEMIPRSEFIEYLDKFCD